MKVSFPTGLRKYVAICFFAEHPMGTWYLYMNENIHGEIFMVGIVIPRHLKLSTQKKLLACISRTLAYAQERN